MAEYVRDVVVTVEVDTNKRTETATFRAGDVGEAIAQLQQWREGMDL